MPLFQKKSPEPEPPKVTGKDVLRGALKNYNRRPAAIAGLNEDLRISAGALDAFAGGADNLPAEKLTGLAKFLWGGHVEFDPESGMLRSAHREPARSLGVRAPPSPIKSREDVAAFFGAASASETRRISESPGRPSREGRTDRSAAKDSPKRAGSAKAEKAGTGRRRLPRVRELRTSQPFNSIT